MDDILLLDAVERYLKGDMTEQERNLFDELRKNNADIDQMVVEHSMFLQQVDVYGDNKNFRQQLHAIHNDLLQAAEISEGESPAQGRVVRFWKRYKRMASIAATIAGVTALVISGLVTYFTPDVNKNELRQLNRKIDQMTHIVNAQANQISVLKSKVPVDATAKAGGTSFIIDAKGYLVTNAHVVAGSSTIIVQNNKGQQYKARIAHMDIERDLAILKIEDDDFKPFSSLPYGLKRSNTDLGEQIYTLGFPRDEIVYNEGYLSAKTGFNGDTISCQIAVSANPGNSGGPVLNKHGEVIGIVSTSQVQAEGVVFAIKSRNIVRALDELKKQDTTYAKVKVPGSSNIKGLDRVQQIKQVEDCVFMVRSFTK